MALCRVEGGDLRLYPHHDHRTPSATPRPRPSRLSPLSLPGRHSCSHRAKSLKGYSSGSSTAAVRLSKAPRALFILRSAFGPRPPRSCCLHRSCWPCTVSSATRGTLHPGWRVRGPRCRRRGTEPSPRPLWGGPPPWAACGRSGWTGWPASLRRRSCGFLRDPDALTSMLSAARRTPVKGRVKTGKVNVKGRGRRTSHWVSWRDKRRRRREVR
jgi:hypothetical protein